MPMYQLEAKPRILAITLAAGILGLFAGELRAADAKKPVPDAEGLAFYDQKIKPILSRNCYKCHSHSGRIKGGLVVDSISGLLEGGDSGPAVLPGDPDKSPLITAVSYKDENLQMPPEGKRLTDDEVALLTAWVKRGAPAPGLDKVGRPKGKISDEDRAWWAFQPVRQHVVPDASPWARNEIDRFISARLSSEGLKPSPEANRRDLIRRVYFDLTGLPPTPAEVDAFVADPAQDAYEQLVNRLLDSPRYGERWARHWLDLARYAESDGFRIDDYRQNAWRYRDYVIKSFNEDKPYDRFVTEQLAGDEIAPNDPDARAATGFLRHTIYEYNPRDVRTQWTDMLNDVTDVTGDVFLGMGMQCARCHDHKFDPILQADYYRLQAYFAGYLPLDNAVLATPEQKAEYEEKLAKWEEKTAEIRKGIEAIEVPKKASLAKGAIEKFPDDIQEMILKPASQREPLEHQLAELAYRQVTYEHDRVENKLKDEDKVKVAALKRELAAHDALKPAPLPTGRIVTEVGKVAPPTMIPKKTNTPALPPGILTILSAEPAKIEPVPTAPHSTGRRTALARWITQPDNPLATRVIVNRIWQYHFGRGLVATSSDFGKLGEKPSHPELLDWLSVRFVKDGWSFKKMHRLILTSAAYRQSATAPAAEMALLKDPENRLLWRANTRRLDAEQIRDSILAVTGELDLTMGGPSVDGTKTRRSIYTKVVRNTRDPLLDVFDTPEGFTSMSQRNVTTTPTQALLLFNGQSYMRHARSMAGRLKKDGQESDEAFVQAAYRAAFGRAPTADESSASQQFLNEQVQKVNRKHAGGTGFVAEKLPYREGKAALLQPAGPQVRLQVADNAKLPSGDFTIEAFVLLRSMYEDGTVRTVASHWGGEKTQAGWSFGVTSKKSAFKPQTLVLQLWGGGTKDGSDYEPVFSGLHVALNKPYYVAASVRMEDTSKAGITFYAKDLSNDDEPMLSAQMEHKIVRRAAPGVAFTIGGRDNKPLATWDGLIDDVRLTGSALKQEELLPTAEGATDKTIGYWQFEARPSPYHDTTGNKLTIRSVAEKAQGDADAKTSVRVDFCHVLLNANEFLYVD